MMTLDLATGEWQLRGIGKTDWIPVSIPGEVHVALMEAGLIPDPFVADNELAVQWVARTDWAFEGVIQVSEEMLSQDRVRLRFNGLDTLAKVSLNGTTLAHTKNAFRTYTWEVKKLLQPGGNKVRVLFDSPVRYAEENRLKNLCFRLSSPSRAARTFEKPLANGAGIGGRNCPRSVFGNMPDLKGFHLQILKWCIFASSTCSAGQLPSVQMLKFHPGRKCHFSCV